MPAGAFSCGDEARILRAKTNFAESSLGELLRAPDREADTARATPWFQRLSKLYVVGVLAVAAAGLVGWWTATGEVLHARPSHHAQAERIQTIRRRRIAEEKSP